MGRRHRDRRPRRARPGRARQHVADGVGHRARVPRRGQVPRRRRVLRRARPRGGRAGRHRRHQPRAAGHRRHGRAGGAARARRGGGRRGARAGRPGHRRRHRRAERGRGRGGRAQAGQADRPVDRPIGWPRRAKASASCSTTCGPAAGRRSPSPRPGRCRRCSTRPAACRTGLGGERREEPGRRRRPQDRAGRAGGGARHHRPAAQGVRRAGSGEALRRRLAGRGGRRPAQGRCTPPRCGSAGCCASGCSGAPRWCSPRPRWPSAATSTRWPGSGGSRPARVAATDDPVPDPEAPKWSGLDVGSPFAHAKSGILYVAKSLPPPGRDGLPPAYLDEIAGLVEAAGGRTLGLFSSMRAAKQATEALRDRAGHTAALPGRRRHDAAGQAVRRGRRDVAVRHAVAVAGRRRARARRSRA